MPAAMEASDRSSDAPVCDDGSVSSNYHFVLLGHTRMGQHGGDLVDASEQQELQNQSLGGGVPGVHHISRIAFCAERDESVQLDSLVCGGWASTYALSGMMC
jgi:hypothetical protein